MPDDVLTGTEKEERNKFLVEAKDTFLKLAKGPANNRTVWVARAWAAEVTFEQDDFNAYPVMEGQQAVGLVSKFDFLACFVFTPAHMMPRYDDLMKRTVGDVMTSDFIYVGEHTRLTRVLQLMVDHRLRSMPVIDGEQTLVGMISRADVLRALQRSAFATA